MNIKHQQGASVVEFTLVIPVLLMFLLLVGEVGIMFYTLNALTKATQGAARYMSEVSGEFGVRKPIAESLLKYGNVTSTAPPLLPKGDALIVTTITIVGPESDHVRVEATYQHDLILGSALGALTGLSTGGSVGFGNTFQLGASSVMRFAQ